MASHEDSWESLGWEALQPEETDRDQVLGLARRLAEQRQRLHAEELVEVEELKRALRERAADVVRRELEVERRTRELDEKADGRRALRLRRGGRPSHEDTDHAYSEEILARRETELQEQLETAAQRERSVTERETALRARELQIEEAETALAQRETEQAEARSSLEGRKTELESSYARLRDAEAQLEEGRRDIDGSREQASRTTDELVTRAASIEAAGQELAAERKLLQEDLSERERRVDERERQVAARERELATMQERAFAREQQDTEAGERRLAALKSRLDVREVELQARESELARLQAGLAAQQESISRRERALEDAERMIEREAVLPATPFVSFSEGLDAFAGAKHRES